MIKKLLLCLLLTSCGSKEPIQNPAASPLVSISTDKLQAEVERLQPILLTCDGGYTKDANHTVTGRPHCDTGDSILFTGLLSTVDNVKANTDYRTFIANSINTDGHPYRSPEHLKICVTPEHKDDASCTFSRDHILGIVLNSIATGNCDSLVKVFNYAQLHFGRFCDGTMAQCSMSIASYDIIGDAYQKCGLTRPLITNINNSMSSYAEVITVSNNDSFQLELAVDFIYAKYLAGTLTVDGLKVVDIAVTKMPWNTYFKYVQALVNGTLSEQKENLVLELLPISQQIAKPGNSWFWQWNELNTANAWSMWFMSKLLLQ